MTEQFDLSKKRTLSLGILNNKVYGYTEEDVKEFIRELDRWKDIMRTWHIELPTIELLCSEFDRLKKGLAGKELIDDTHNTITKGVKNGNN